MRTLDRAAFLSRLLPKLADAGLVRVHPDVGEPNALAALQALAGIPAYELVFAGDARANVVLLGLIFGERTPGVEVARRAQLLFSRAQALAERRGGRVIALQLALYERDVPPEERRFVLGKARRVPLLFGTARVATWVVALQEPALYVKRLPGWPQELAAPALRELLTG